jgi:hypothetical protein
MRVVTCLRPIAARRGLAIAIVAAGAAWSAWACLPDLAALPPAARGPYCGDGIVDWAREGGIGEQCDPSEAGARGCTSVCNVDCPSGGYVDPETLHCYFLRDPRPSLKDAQNLCELEGAHVVTFSSNTEYDAFHGWYVDESARFRDSYFWIGLAANGLDQAYGSSALDEPGFGVPAASCPGCFGRLPANSDYFATTDASPGARSLGCVVGLRANKGLPWYQALCAGNRVGGTGPIANGVTVCEREPPGQRSRPCDAGQCVDLPSTRSVKKYVFKSERATSAAAAAFCRTLPQGELVMPDTREERAQLAREIGRLTPRDGQPASTFWIGLSTTNGSPWHWDDGAPISDRPSLWGDREPKPAGKAARAYVQISATSYDTTLAHVDADTASMRPFVCQYR